LESYFGAAVHNKKPLMPQQNPFDLPIPSFMIDAEQRVEALFEKLLIAG
jgi:hypothetical protein